MLGEVPPPYLSSISITNGGSGYTPGEVYKLNISDTTGQYLSGIAVANSNGVISQTFVTEAGIKVSGNPTIELMTSPGSGATFQGFNTDDSQTYGETGGPMANYNLFDFCKMECAGNAPGVTAHGARPDSGFAIRCGEAAAQNFFRNTNVSAESDVNGVPMYQFRWAYVAGTPNHFIFPDTYGLATNNPNGDRGLFRITLAGSLFVEWQHQMPVTNA